MAIQTSAIVAPAEIKLEIPIIQFCMVLPLTKFGLTSIYYRDNSSTTKMQKNFIYNNIFDFYGISY
jgi:hypothetical protein